MHTASLTLGSIVGMLAITTGCSDRGITDDGLIATTSTGVETSNATDASSGQPGTGTSSTSSPGTSADSTGTSAATPTTDSSDSGSPIVFDMGIPDGPPPDLPCSNVDLLFVIDDSGSMTAFQEPALDSFLGFIQALQVELAGTVDSYHVGVITSDAYTGNAPGCTDIGHLVTQTSGFGSSNQVCTPFQDGYRFLTEQDDMAVSFPCIALVGSSGSPIEQPVTATIAALDPGNAGPGDCNEGFLRDDAILVIVILTDDPPYDPDFDDAHPLTDTSGWYDAILQAKHGDPNAMVVIGFVPWNDVSCVPFNIESPNLIGFVESFGTQGVLASICEPDYGPILTSAVDTVVATCESFDEPP
jgi:hypothetical protein